MKAAIIKGKGILSVEEVPNLQAGTGEVVIKVKYCGICGSDVHLFHDGFYPVGLIMGHEFCGRISEVGRGVEGWAVGDRVAVMPAVTCGGCYYCLRGQRHHCRNIKIVGVDKEMQGAFAEYVRVKANMLHRLPEQVTDEEAANIEPCAVSLRAVRQSGVMVGDSVVVFGAGYLVIFVRNVQTAGFSSSEVGCAGNLNINICFKRVSVAPLSLSFILKVVVVEADCLPSLDDLYRDRLFFIKVLNRVDVVSGTLVDN